MKLFIVMLMLSLPTMGQSEVLYTHNGECLNCRYQSDVLPSLKMYDLQKATFTEPKTVVIHLPYDVDTAFNMAKIAW